MQLLDIVNRKRQPQPWAEGEKIPWNDPAFSRRMLKEHLSQDHDAASRRFAVADQQTRWIHDALLGGTPSRILDLGCGPGIYAARLAQLGHACTGIDFSPASVEYARQQAEANNLNCQYTLADIRSADYGTGYSLAMLIFGEINVFHPDDAHKILRAAHAALDDDGMLLVEPHRYETVHQIGTRPPGWYTSRGGLFAEREHLCLIESFWSDRQQAAIERFYVIDGHSGLVQAHAATTQAYTTDEFNAMLAACGFSDIQIYSEWPGVDLLDQADLYVLTARKR